jgi:pimeloyl-ACP methyl ester carboxylesterase
VPPDQQKRHFRFGNRFEHLTHSHVQETTSRASSDATTDGAGVPLAAVARSLTDETQFITTNDGVPIAYDSLGKSGPVIVLLHGWSGSRHYFELNARVRTHASCGHGRSIYVGTS